jgi:UDP-N-acetylglucosamine 2-epimerase (non-hydrolysing)
MENSKRNLMRILVAYGTRPECIKIKPLLKAFDKCSISYKTVKVKQHTTLLDSDVVADQSVEIYEDKYCSYNRLDSITKSVLTAFHIFEDVTHVLVQGDTTAAMSVALAAFHKGLPVMHLEAGLRTYDKDSPFPEEINRRIISSLASIHFCPTKGDKINLIKEGLREDLIYVTGNTVIDNICDIIPPPHSNKEVLITMHRRENHKGIEEWFSAIESLAAQYPEYEFIFPMHPNPNIQKHKKLFNAVNVCSPLEYKEMRVRLAACSCVISDSGGIQEECNYFKKICYVCRTSTERACPTNVMCKSPSALKKSFVPSRTFSTNDECSFGDGHAAEKIAKIIQEL